jgi:hypothetical protein
MNRSTELRELESLAAMFEALSVRERFDGDDWRTGYDDGLSHAYRMCAESVRNSIRRLS